MFALIYTDKYPQSSMFLFAADGDYYKKKSSNQNAECGAHS